MFFTTKVFLNGISLICVVERCVYLDIVLSKKIKAKRLIEGFPGFGLVGTIVTEYLIEHLKFEKIGEFIYDELPATVAIHKGKLVHPMGVFYSKKLDLILLHAILDVRGMEWKIADVVTKLIKQTGVKEIISVEGVSATGSDNLFCYNNKEFEKMGATPVKESVIMGVTAALMVRGVDLSCIFAETQSNIPDSRAAAKVMAFLNKYLGLELNVQPLLDQAELFETKLKGIMQQTNQTLSEADKKKMSYFG